MPKPTKKEQLNPGTWRAFRVNGICSAMTKRAKLAGSSSWPGCGTSVQQSVCFPPPDRATGIFKNSSRTVFRSGKPKTRNSCRSFCASLGEQHNWFADETGIPVSPAILQKKDNSLAMIQTGRKEKDRESGARLNQRTNFGEDWASAE
jgi:hypothetical protein